MKSKLLVAIVLCVTMSIGTFACSGGGIAPNGMTGGEILEMSQNASVNTVQFDATMNMDVLGAAMAININGAVDEVNEEMRILMQSPGVSEESMQIYAVDGWIYSTDSEGGWIKTELTDGSWEDQDMVGQQMGLMEDYLEARYLGMENIVGVNCYKIDVIPNWDAIFSAVDISETEGLSSDEMVDMIKDTSCVIWVAESTYLPVQIFFSVTLEMDLFGQTYSMPMDMTMTFSNINQPVTIVLPVAAENATEISYDEFMEGNW